MENNLSAHEHDERADAMLYERVTEHACERGVDTLLAVLRDWFEERAQLYPVASGHRVAYDEVADMCDQMREVVEQAGAKALECAAYAPKGDNGAPYGDGT